MTIKFDEIIVRLNENNNIEIITDPETAEKVVKLYHEMLFIFHKIQAEKSLKN